MELRARKKVIEYPEIRSFAGLTDLGPKVTGKKLFCAADFCVEVPPAWTKLR